MKKPLTLSIVIPVYNEERHIKACLEAIAGQSVKPDEVIVVDNNCTDRTVAIAWSYPFVRVIKEKQQGHAPPRNRGFNAARSDIIGRIDADSRIMPDWVKQVKADFASGEVAGVTGMGRTDSIPRVHSPKSTIWCHVYYWGTHAYFNTITSWGANMAVRRDAWLAVKDNELWLVNATITGTSQVRVAEEDQTRTRKLLAKHREIEALMAAKQQGQTIVPTEVLTSGHYIKVRIAVGRGRKKYDKREALKKHDQKRSMQAALKYR